MTGANNHSVLELGEGFLRQSCHCTGRGPLGVLGAPSGPRPCPLPHWSIS